METLDQGTVLFGLRSEKYPNSRCFGIIITASCDIANCKVSKLYYLQAFSVKDWFCTEFAYSQVYGQKIRSSLDLFESVAAKHSLDATSLQLFSREDVIQIIDKEVCKQKDRIKVQNAYDQFCVYCRPEMTDEERKKAIQSDTKPVISFLDKVGRGEIFHYYYLPKAAYLKSEEKDDGLIVDFQEIESISMDDALKIVTPPGIDYLCLSQYSPEEQERLNKMFWLTSGDDFVGIEGKISSPWREHLIQRFSHSFARIGLDGATSADHAKLAGSI